MQAILDFLLEYYMWVLGLLGALLVTLIGFLADARKRKKMREKKKMKEKEVKENSVNENDNVNFNSLSQGINMDYNFGQESLNDPFANNNVMPASDVNMPSSSNDSTGYMQPDAGLSMNGDLNASGPSVNNVSNDSFFVPASNQTPSFEPLNIPTQAPNNMDNMMQNVEPPVNMSLNQGMNNNVPPMMPNNMNYPGVNNMMPNNNMMANQFQAPPIQVTSIPEMVQQSSVNMPPFNSMQNDNMMANQVSNFGPSVNMDNGNVSPVSNNMGFTNMMGNNNAMPGPMPAAPNPGPASIIPSPTGSAVPNPIPNFGPSVNTNNGNSSPVSNNMATNNMMPNQGTYPMNNMPNFVSGQNNNN